MTPHVDIGAERPEPPRARASYFARRLAFVRDPAGGSGGKGPAEDARGLVRAGFSAVAFNVGDYPIGRWATWRAACLRHDLDTGPWARCHTALDCSALAAAADELRADFAIVNLEQEAREARWVLSAGEVVRILERFAGPKATSTEPWLPDNFGWELLDEAGYACLPQAFGPASTVAIVDRARAKFRDVFPTLGAFAGCRTPLVYRAELDGAGLEWYSVAFSDDVADWRLWSW